jgi:hypothetical protein
MRERRNGRNIFRRSREEEMTHRREKVIKMYAQRGKSLPKEYKWEVKGHKEKRKREKLPEE